MGRVNQLAATCMPSAIVTDASERLALHVVRALGRRHVPVRATDLAGREEHPLAFRSRYATAGCLTASWDHSESAWLEGLLEAGAPGDVLLPTCLNTILRVLQNRESLSRRYRMLLPAAADLRTANDKWSLYQVCRDLGLACPASYSPTSLDEVRDLAGDIAFPVIVKFRNDEDLYAEAASRYARVDSADGLPRIWERFHALQPNPLIQQFVAGDGWGFECLYDGAGKPVARFCHRRLMEYPVAGGPSAVCESVHVPEIVARGERLLEALSWRGVAMVEFKRCARTGKFYVLEINPRFWGSLALSEAAGVNFPHLLYRAALGETFKAPQYRAGVRMRIMPTYLLSGLSALKASPLDLTGALRRLSYLLDPRVREGLFCLDDPRPALAYVRARVGAA